MIPVCRPWLPGREKEYVKDAIDNNWISSSGSYIERFEREFSKFEGVNYGVSCSNCFGALHLACSAIGLKKRDEVIVTTFTMCSPVNAIILTGAKPVLVDINPETYNIDVSKIEEKITAKTKAILAVHIYGNPCDMNKILDIAKKYHLYVIEDCAEAHGAEYKGKKVGSFGDIGCFSFYANKIITTGEGGMAITNNFEFAEKMKKLRNYAFEIPRFLHREMGFNYRLTNLQAAIGVAQTENAEKLVEARRNVGLRYNQLLQNVPGLILPVEKPETKNVYWMYGIVLSDEIELSKEEVMERLKERGVETRSFFIPMHKQPVFLEKKVENSPDCFGNFKVAEKIGERGFYLPSSSDLSDEEIETVCRELKFILSGNLKTNYIPRQDLKIGEESGIEEKNNRTKSIKFQKVEPVHKDERRELIPMFNGDFTAKQIKILKIKKGSVLGNHYHEYNETFYLLEGEAHYVFEDIKTKERQEIHLKAGERITIEPRIAHKAEFFQDTVMIEGTQEPYTSKEVNDKYYEVK